MGRIFPKTLVEFYEPRIHRDWLRDAGGEKGLTRRETMLVRLFILFLIVAFLTTPYLQMWIAQQTPGSTINAMWQVHLISLGGTVLFTALCYALYRLLRFLYKRCRVRIRLTDQFVQRFHMSGGPVVFWKHADRAVLEVVSFGGHTWAVLEVYSTKSHPLRVGIPEDQPVESILQALADLGIPVAMTQKTPT